MGVVLTTYKSWDDPPSRPIALYNLRYDDAPLRNPGFAQVLEQVNNTSRSVRVMKRLLEHQPSKDPEARASRRFVDISCLVYSEALSTKNDGDVGEWWFITAC